VGSQHKSFCQPCFVYWNGDPRIHHYFQVWLAHALCLDQLCNCLYRTGPESSNWSGQFLLEKTIDFFEFRNCFPLIFLIHPALQYYSICRRCHWQLWVPGVKQTNCIYFYNKCIQFLADMSLNVKHRIKEVVGTKNWPDWPWLPIYTIALNFTEAVRKLKFLRLNRL
jgi:hypothetical protein